MLYLLFILPALAGAAALLLGTRSVLLLQATALAHLGLTLTAILHRAPRSGAWIQMDALGALFLGITSVLFLAASLYAGGYLKREGSGTRPDLFEGRQFANTPDGVFCACLLWFLASMTLVCLSHQLNLLWIGVEATTLSSTPLIYFHRHHRSLEATWKYLLVCSVGIGLALLGNFFVVVAGSGVTELRATPLQLDHLLAHAAQLSPAWLKLGFILLAVGYGTKMGLAPMHTWLPDTHSESPSLVSALLSGTLLNCAFLGVIRGFVLVQAAGLGAFAQEIMLFFGLVSLTVASVFILNTRDFKRMLAYSSVEHMGILAFGLGLGPVGWFGALFHALNHSLVKGAMFLLAGGIMESFHTRAIAQVRGLLHCMPLTGALWMGGFLALTGSPPFSPFLSEFMLFRATLVSGRPVLAACFVTALAVVFVGMSRAILGMAQGQPQNGRRHEHASSLVSPLLLLSVALVLGVYLPPWLTALLQEGARALGGS